MKNFVMCMLPILALAFGVFAGPAIAQDTKAPTVKTEKPNVTSESGFDILRGRWVRPDGGYVITIRGVDARRQTRRRLRESQAAPVRRGPGFTGRQDHQALL